MNDKWNRCRQRFCTQLDGIRVENEILELFRLINIPIDVVACERIFFDLLHDVQGRGK